ncbi:serine/threonine-protein kinase [Cohnella phaseoli]|uniref:Serine/threonine-protein kinase n=1 Tax=Cohnella phaseoli TaxID=456490 RepID=A0A3D9HQQ9_9BACL|nr:serine/threonine-protein kinase [Cohnella phaseoli]RED51779.1 serine/threonine-protein kinase [Cohnella phaseoli]
MAINHIFTIEEHQTGLEVNKIYRNEYRFPVEMLVKGRKYSGVEATLNKQHGKKILMEFVLKLLSNGPKQYKYVISQMLQKFNWFDLSDALEILLLDGVIQITFKNLNPRKSVSWLPKIVGLDPRAVESLLPQQPDIDLEFIELRKSVINLTVETRNPLKKRILQWIEERKIQDQSGTLIADVTSFRKYKSVILTIAHYIYLRDRGQTVPLRYLSNQIWDHPRLLCTYKNESALAAEITLDELDSVLLNDINSTLHAPLVSISPVEELQRLVDQLLEPETSQDAILSSVSLINSYIHKIIEIVGDSENKTLNLLDYYDLHIKFTDSGSAEAELSILIDFKERIAALKKEILKIGHIRHRFEMIVLEEVGSGSFARVYRVFDPESNKIVACKILFPRTYFKQIYANDGDEYILRFKREVRLLTKELQHRNIIEVGKIQLDGSPFWFTMPLASFTLEKWMKNNRNASVDQRMEIFKQIISGIKYLHKREKYHRDLAPNNILLFETNHGLEVKIADFGLAKDTKSKSFFTGLSKRGYGQEDFTDPQQLNNLADSTHLSDIYSLGALLYYLLSNKLPKRRFYFSIMYQSVVMKAMDKRNKRYQTVYDFEYDLNECMKLDE